MKKPRQSAADGAAGFEIAGGLPLEPSSGGEQWGSGLSGVEGTARVAVHPHHRRSFNGATAFRPRKELQELQFTPTTGGASMGPRPSGRGSPLRAAGEQSVHQGEQDGRAKAGGPGPSPRCKNRPLRGSRSEQAESGGTGRANRRFLHRALSGPPAELGDRRRRGRRSRRRHRPKMGSGYPKKPRQPPPEAAGRAGAAPSGGFSAVRRAPQMAGPGELSDKTTPHTSGLGERELSGQAGCVSARRWGRRMSLA